MKREIRVKDMVPGNEYRSKTDILCRIDKKPDLLAEEVCIYFYEDEYQKCWLPCKIKTTEHIWEVLDDTNHRTLLKKQSKMTYHKSTHVGIKGGGLVTGLKMLQCWGLYFNKHIDTPGGRELIIEDMNSEFPNKEESNQKWVDSYKSYYNLGKLPNCKKQEKKKNFIPK